MIFSRYSLRHSIALALLCLTTAASADAAPPDISGYWLVQRYVEQVRTVDGQVPPLKPEAQMLYQQHAVDKRASKLDFDPAAKCINPGIPRAMFLPYAVEFLQSKDTLAMLFAWNHLYRVINVTDKAPVSDQPAYLGTATGKWQGSSFVVKTTGLKEESLLDATGLPSSKDMQVTERYTLSKDGKELTNLITFNDPINYTRPWQTRVTYKKLPADFYFTEDVCLDRLDQGKPAIDVPKNIPVG